MARQEKEEENNKKRVLWFNFLQQHLGEGWTMDFWDLGLGFEEAFWDCDFEEAERLIQEVERLIQEDDDL